METPDALEDALKEIIEKRNEKDETKKRAMRMLRELQQDNKVCKLEKAIYGLKQSGRQWHNKLNGILIREGLQTAGYDPCACQTEHKGTKLIVLKYVDDILIARNNAKEINNL